MCSPGETFISVESLKMLCRLCLSVNDKLHQIFSLDETESSAIPLWMKVSLCTAITISKSDDMFPQKICQNCLNHVNEWYSFRKKCKKVNLFLEKTISDKMNYNSKNGIELKHDMKVLTETVDGITLKEFERETNHNEVNNDISNSLVDRNNVSSKWVTDKTKITDCFVESSSLMLRKKKFSCSMCPDSFYYPKDLKLHRNFIHNIKATNLTKRVAMTPDPEIRLEGINIRTRYEMKCCDKIFFSKMKFRKHYNEKHPGEKPFMCETCGKKDFISEETLKRHKVLHTGKFRCEICLKTFTCNAILILHKRDKHENDKPFVCDVCGKRFVTELLMNYHKRFHTGEKKYVCEECGLAVVTSSSLAKHKRIHSKEKPHICHMCGKGFIVKGRLIEHLRVHTGERPYTCQVCQKGFTMRDKLKRHLRIHSGEKMFSCEYCGHSYSSRYGLSVHLKSHMEQVPKR